MEPSDSGRVRADRGGIKTPVDTFGTGKIDDLAITKLVREHFELRPGGLTEMLQLLKPIYQQTAAYGHFGREEFSWEQTDKAEALKSEAGL